MTHCEAFAPTFGRQPDREQSPGEGGWNLSQTDFFSENLSFSLNNQLGMLALGF